MSTGQACRALGVAEHSLFETVDLFEDKDLGLVVRCLFALGSAVQLTVCYSYCTHIYQTCTLYPPNLTFWGDEKRTENSKLSSGILLLEQRARGFTCIFSCQMKLFISLGCKNLPKPDGRNTVAPRRGTWVDRRIPPLAETHQ